MIIIIYSVDNNSVSVGIGTNDLYLLKNGVAHNGKTTLLNQILQNKQDLKVAVLVNEFGDINLIMKEAL